MSTAKKFESIQALRALAAIGVVAYHVSGNVLEAGWLHRWFHALSLYGVMGVDVFFVISGFVMALVTANLRPGFSSAASFIKARIARVVPMYWAMTVLFVALALFLPAALVYEPLPLSKVVTSFLFIPHLNSAGKVEPVLYVGWTLYYEMWFYLVFAAALLFAKRPLVVVSAFLLVTSFGLLLPIGGAAFTTYTNPIVLEFVAGAWLGAMYARGGRLPIWISAMLVIAALASHQIIRPTLTEANRFWVFGIPAFAFVCLFVSMERRIQWRALTGLGDASYSIYLVQVFSVPIAIKCAMALDPARTVSGEWICVGVTALATLIGAVAHRFVERPLIRLVRRASASTNRMGRLADGGS